MTVARPTKVKIGHARYTIIWSEEEGWPQDMLDAGGITYSHNSQIWVRLGKKDDRMGTDTLREVLLHEIQHAVWASCQITHHEWISERDVEETAIRFSTPVLLDVIRENPAVFRWLADK